MLTSARSLIMQESESRLKALRKRRDKSMNLSALAVEAKLNKRRKALQWRTPRDLAMRSAAAWSLSLLLTFLALLLTAVLCVRVEETETSRLLLAWLAAYGWTAVVIEPMQVFLLAFLPCLYSEATRCGRGLLRCRFVVNELCMP